MIGISCLFTQAIENIDENVSMNLELRSCFCIKSADSTILVERATQHMDEKNVIIFKVFYDDNYMRN